MRGAHHSSMDRFFPRLGALLGATAALFAVFFLVARPWYLRWGATAEDQRRPLPGDDIAIGTGPGETRAIAIHAPPAKIWPWLAQLGQDRGGFYSFERLE